MLVVVVGTTAAIAPAHALARGPSVGGVLTSLERRGAITEAAYTHYRGAYAAAQSSLRRLTGTRRAELQSVISNVQAIAASGELTPSRLGALFLTLERNRQWWTTEPLLSSGERVSFPPSRLVWEYYAGQGIEIQWLGTFGEANGYYLSGHENANLRQLLGEAIPLASERAGGIAWEYLFHFDGGSPPWTSGLSQGTAVQVLARAWSRLKEPAYLTAAQQALGVFQTAPPQGVRVKTRAGAEYAEYSYAPSDRILNGFIQALVGLYDYTSITKDPLGLALFEAGDAQARAEVPRYDTGAWSLYDQFGESSLNYHELLAEFLQHLCERTRKGPPVRQASAAIAGDEIYCTTAQRFTTDLRTPPAVSLITTTLPTGARAGVQVSLSKIATVRITVRRNGRTVWSNAATVERGRPRLLWVTPSQTGAYSITVTAADLAGNFATGTGTITLAKGAKPH
ncbi:MAG TPA: D-glucuronyl C5-epimerase family protein [Solirubrobacteraceae bacterium]|nr:D-glucuronyl C5-epimerase family protein [Solirubrobacteraceae bacterium]